MRVKKTSRGFQLIEFKDLYGEACSIQQSSLADKAALWLGAEHETIHKVTGEKCGARMHIDRKLAKQLIAILHKWVQTGRLK